MPIQYEVPNTERDLRILKSILGSKNRVFLIQNAGIQNDGTAFGPGSKSSVQTPRNGIEAFFPTLHEVGAYASYPPAQGTVWTIDGTDSAGRYHVRPITPTVEVHGPVNAFNLWYLDDPIPKGQYHIISPAPGQTLTLKNATDLTGNNGNFYIGADVVLSESQFIWIQWRPDLGAQGMWIIPASVASSISGTIPWSKVTPIDTDKDMNQKSLTNLNLLRFKSTGSNIGFETSGDGRVLDFRVNGQIIATMSSTPPGPFFDQIVGELIDSGGSGHPVAMKLAYLPSVPNPGFIGEYDFDGFTNLGIQRTFAKIQGKSTNITDNAIAGELHFLVGNSGGQNPVDTLVLSYTELQPLSGSLNLGDSTHFFINAYCQAYFIGSTNQQLFTDGLGNLVFSQLSSKKMQWQFGGTARMILDDSQGFLQLTNAVGLSVSGFAPDFNPLTIVKLTGFPAEFTCSLGFQFDNPIIMNAIPDFEGGFVLTATAGGSTLPNKPAGFIQVKTDGGGSFVIPVYNP